MNSASVINSALPAGLAQPEPLPANVGSIQPGGGVCCRLELAWGQARRWYLKQFRPDYVARMAALRVGDATGCPHEILDPRDLKHFRNQCDCRWPAEVDPFRWRERIPFARWGLAELMIFGIPLFAVTIAAGLMHWYLTIVPAILLALIVYFFRDPPRRVPAAPGLIVSPADGRLVEITQIDNDPFIGGPAVRFGIFLSIFNVHINRAPLECRVIRLLYHPGPFLNALDPKSARVNENMWIGCQETAPPHRRLVVRQIAGAIARRIVCDLRPGEWLTRGQKFGMIKLGSRTELVLPLEDDFVIEARIGDRVRAGATILARYRTQGSTS